MQVWNSEVEPSTVDRFQGRVNECLCTLFLAHSAKIINEHQERKSALHCLAESERVQHRGQNAERGCATFNPGSLSLDLACVLLPFSSFTRRAQCRAPTTGLPLTVDIVASTYTPAGFETEIRTLLPLQAESPASSLTREGV